MSAAKDSHEFICATNADYVAWCATFYAPEALDGAGKRSLDGQWAWQEQERRKRAALAALQAPDFIKDLPAALRDMIDCIDRGGDLLAPTKRGLQDARGRCIRLLGEAEAFLKESNQ